MSLDVYLKIENRKCECGQNNINVDEEVFEANITHNLTRMASEAGIYKHLWRPEELNITKAKDLIKPLTDGLKDMKSRPDHYKKFNADNGWGVYNDFIPWIEKYLEACIEYPEATIYINR